MDRLLARELLKKALQKALRLLGRIGWRVLLILFVCGAGVVATLYLEYQDSLPAVVPLADLAARARGGRAVLAVDDAPPLVVQAFLAAEDPDFLERSTWDARGASSVVAAKVRAAGGLPEGRTISSQLAEMMLRRHDDEHQLRFRGFATWLRELILTYRLERQLAKKEILAQYLDAVYLGGGTRGVVAASERYFHKRLSELTLAETATLAAIPASPTRFSPAADLGAMRERRRAVLDRMLAAGAIAREAHDAAVAEEVVGRGR